VLTVRAHCVTDDSLHTLADIYNSIIPFVLVMIIGLALVMALPHGCLIYIVGTDINEYGITNAEFKRTG